MSDIDMSALTQLFEYTKRASDDANMEKSSALSQFPGPYPPIPQSPRSATASSSNPTSPATSLFSTRTHSRFPSSGSSVDSSPGAGSLTMKTHLAEVKEEPHEREAPVVEEGSYFAHFDDFYAVDTMEGEPSNSLDSVEYELSSDGAGAIDPPKKRLSDNQHFKSISRISSQLSSISSKRKKKQQLSDTAAALERYDESLRSRASSTTSTLVGPPISSLSRRQSNHSLSPPRTVLEESLKEANVAPIDVDKANAEQDSPEAERHATTPLLPPVTVEFPNPNNNVSLDSPLQSPTVADTSEHPAVATTSVIGGRTSEFSSPPISAQPSLSSLAWQVPPTRACGTDMAAPMGLEDPVDEWSQNLGHANFTIIPEPYTPSVSNVETLREHKSSWELARCNFAKHLVRTGEHYGVTSHIYKLTGEKWESINDQWKTTHSQVAAKVADGKDNPVALCTLNTHANEAIRLPRLHDKEKFPELGDEDIVGPMTVAPQPPTFHQDKPRKRSLLKSLRKIFC